MKGRAARFWNRSRDWPVVGQLAFAVLVVVVVAMITIALDGNGAARQTASVVAINTATSSPHPSTAQRSTSSTATATTGRTTSTTPPTTKPRATTTPPSTRPPAGLLSLTIAAPSHAAEYDRGDFGGWIDQGACHDTRAVLLIRTSSAAVTFTSSSDCTVKTGRWIDPWSGVMTTVAHTLDVDHTVPLENAWVSGAWSWSPEQRVAYTNDLADRDHLVPVLLSENRSKGDRGPDGWKPPAASSWCRYALAWDRIKAKWHLSATPTEWSALLAMATTC